MLDSKFVTMGGENMHLPISVGRQKWRLNKCKTEDKNNVKKKGATAVVMSIPNSQAPKAQTQGGKKATRSHETGRATP